MYIVYTQIIMVFLLELFGSFRIKLLKYITNIFFVIVDKIMTL